MAQRRYITLSDRAAAIYDGLPRGTRGEWVSARIEESTAPPLLPHSALVLLVEWGQKHLSWYDKQGQK